MDHPYSFWADWLSKFNMASEPIQALWIVALAGTVLGALGLVTHGAVEIFGARRRSRGEPGEPIIWPRPVREPRGPAINPPLVIPGPDSATHALAHRDPERRGPPG